jgi:N,N-dimethylformamidase
MGITMLCRFLFARHLASVAQIYVFWFQLLPIRSTAIMPAPDFAPSWLEKISAWKAYPNNPSQYRHYGLSTYNNHTDGSGICHASHKRVLFNLRPGYLTFGEATCSGLRHFQADSHLIAWLHNQNIDYDIITDDELDRDGVAAIEGYKACCNRKPP